MLGSDLLRRFEKVELVKSGGQRTVYRAAQGSTFVAVKIGSFGSTTALERISREIEVQRTLDSVYYPRNLSFDIAGDQYLIVEEYVDGSPLTECMPRFFDPGQALGLLRHLIVGLNLLWERHIVHRDIKPDNIIITASGMPKILDLGIARMVDLDSLTRTIAMLGPCTPMYAAPEQLRNRKTMIDHRTDQFLLGLLTLQLLFRGRHPFDPAVVGSGESIVTNLLTDNWYRAGLKATRLAPVYPLISRMLGSEPFQRFRTKEMLLQATDKCIEVYDAC
ncbi:MAG: protein kinase domain-containing protein [Bacillota bacterium]